jgi:hypothetical protein
MKKWIILLALLSTHLMAAPEWVDATEGDHSFKVDKNSIQKNGDIVSVQVMVNDEDKTSARVFYDFKCSSNEVRVTQLDIYSQPDLQGEPQSSQKLDSMAFAAIDPKENASILKLVCQ